MKQSKPKKRGRPVKHAMPDPIPDTAENIAKAILTTPPKKSDEWEYMKDFAKGK